MRKLSKISDKAAYWLLGFIVGTAVLPLSAAELGNWRSSFYPMAQLLGEIESSSPSRLFWDDIRGQSYPNARLWPDQVWDSLSYWHFAPGLSLLSHGINFESWNYLARIRSDIRYGPFFVRNVADINPEYRDDPNYPYNRRRGSAGYWEEAYFQHDNPIGFLRLGRLKRNWGPFVDRSLHISSNPLSYDALEWQIKGSFFEFRHLVGSFPKRSSQRDIINSPEVNQNPTSTRLKRWLLGHTLNFMLSDWVTIGIMEALVLSTENGLPDLATLNPFTSYTLMSTNAESDGNVMLGVQWQIHPFLKSVSLLGQVVFDDIQVDNELINDQEPLHWGADLGVHWRDPFRSLALRHGVALEYTYASRWMYLVTWKNTSQGERWGYQQRSLGLTENDFDRWRLAFTAAGNNWWQAGLEFAHQRRGGNTVVSPWNTAHSWNGYRKETSLHSDTTEYTVEQTLNAIFYVAPYAQLELGFTNAWVKNMGNVLSDWEYDPRVNLSVSAQYPDFFLRFR